MIVSPSIIFTKSILIFSYLYYYINVLLIKIKLILLFWIDIQTLISHNLIIMEDKNFKKLFGLRIRYLRNLAQLSQEKLAERVGLSTKTITCRWIRCSSI